MPVISIESFVAYAKDLFLSEPVPEKNSGPVKIVVGKNFKEMVVDSSRDVMIEFYDPVCKFCVQLAPIWDELGAKLKNENVDIMRINVTKNDWPKLLYSLDHLPTIYWKPGNDRKPIMYKGDRNLESLIKFISQHATNELKGWDRQGKAKK